MSKEQNIGTFTASDIERYHKGLMSSKERNALEKAALDDPLLADALEGYSHSADTMQEDLADLQKRLENRTKETRAVPLSSVKASYSWWKVAAMIVVVIGAGLLVYQFVFNKKHSELAQNQKESPAPIATKDSLNDTTSSTGRTENNTAFDSATIGRVKDDKTARDGRNLPLKATDPGLVDKEAKSDADRNDDEADKQSEKSAAQESEALTKNKEEKAINTLPKEEEQVAKSRRNDNAPVVTANADYKRAESKPNTATSALPQQGFSSNRSNVFRGRVTDNNNNALPFTNITNLNDNIGTYSDAKGNFVLTSPDSVLNVQIRSLGFETTNAQLFPLSEENKIQMEGDKSITATVLDTAKRNTNRSRNSNMALEEPEPADGWNNYDMYLANNLKSPESVETRQRSGTVELVFDIDNNGIPYNIVVKKSLCESCDKEAIRLIKEGPKWKRKLKKRTKATVTVSF